MSLLQGFKLLSLLYLSLLLITPKCLIGADNVSADIRVCGPGVGNALQNTMKNLCRSLTETSTIDSITMCANIESMMYKWDINFAVVPAIAPNPTRVCPQHRTCFNTNSVFGTCQRTPDINYILMGKMLAYCGLSERNGITLITGWKALAHQKILKRQTLYWFLMGYNIDCKNDLESGTGWLQTKIKANPPPADSDLSQCSLCSWDFDGIIPLNSKLSEALAAPVAPISDRWNSGDGKAFAHNEACNFTSFSVRGKHAASRARQGRARYCNRNEGFNSNAQNFCFEACQSKPSGPGTCVQGCYDEFHGFCVNEWTCTQ